jgi:hypothetical protein
VEAQPCDFPWYTRGKPGGRQPQGLWMSASRLWITLWLSFLGATVATALVARKPKRQLASAMPARCLADIFRLDANLPPMR